MGTHSTSVIEHSCDINSFYTHETYEINVMKRREKSVDFILYPLVSNFVTSCANYIVKYIDYTYR